MRLGAQQVESLRTVLGPYVVGKRVWDIGCGVGVVAVGLLRMGAREVEGVDKDVSLQGYWAQIRRPGLTFTREYVADWAPAFHADVAVLSWLVNRKVPGLVPWLEIASTVVFIGENTDACCGGPDFWSHVLQRRRVLAHDLGHTQIAVYQEMLPERRVSDLTPEEQAAIELWRL